MAIALGGGLAVWFGLSQAGLVAPAALAGALLALCGALWLGRSRGDFSRESVTDAAGHLQAAGYIRYRRGHIGVLDRAGLERSVCECYGVVKKELDRLLSDVKLNQ